jgi:hypothetical protein
LEHYSIDGNAKYLTSGAGGMVIGHMLRENETTTLHKPGERVHSVWLKIVTGFTSHTFMNDNSKVVTEFWDTNQNVIYNMTISRTL